MLPRTLFGWLILFLWTVVVGGFCFLSGLVSTAGQWLFDVTYNPLIVQFAGVFLIMLQGAITTSILRKDNREGKVGKSNNSRTTKTSSS